jgi:hypothetical protein
MLQIISSNPNACHLLCLDRLLTRLFNILIRSSTNHLETLSPKSQSSINLPSRTLSMLVMWICLLPLILRRRALLQGQAVRFSSPSYWRSISKLTNASKSVRRSQTLPILQSMPFLRIPLVILKVFQWLDLEEILRIMAPVGFFRPITKKSI